MKNRMPSSMAKSIKHCSSGFCAPRTERVCPPGAGIVEACTGGVGGTDWVERKLLLGDTLLSCLP